MRAMVINDFGGSEVFEEAELARPEVTVGHVLVRVCASSVNPVDFKIRQLGAALPFAPTLPAVLGMDFAGTIEAVGEGVSDFSPGDEIYGCAGGLGSLKGSLSEFMLADARLIAHKPRMLGMREAAALPLVSITAYEGLQRAGVFTTNENEVKKVLVHGGSGGVGHIAVQLARYFKQEVFATGGGSTQMDLIEGLGAKAINYKEQSVADYVEAHTDGAGFDAIFDSVGDANLSKSIEAIKLNGDIATTMAHVVEYTGRYANLVGYDPNTTKSEKITIATADIEVMAHNSIPVILRNT